MYHVLDFNNVCSNSLFIIVEVLWKDFKKWRLKVHEIVGKKNTIISIATKQTKELQKENKEKQNSRQKKSMYSSITSFPMQSFKFNGKVRLNA